MPLNVHTIVGCDGKPNDPACNRCPANTRVEFLYPSVSSPEARLRNLTRLQDKKPGNFRIDALGDVFASHISDSEAYMIIKHCHAMPRHKFTFATRFPERLVKNQAIMRKLTSCDHIHVGVRISVAADIDRAELFFSKFLPVRYVAYDPVMEDLRHIPVDGAHYAIISAHDGVSGKPFPEIGILDLVRSLESRGVRPFVRNIGNQGVNPIQSTVDPGGYNNKFWINKLQEYTLP